MVKYDCERCAKSFDHKNDYAKHLNKKKPCNGDDNAPTLEILKQRLAELENTVSAMNVPKNPEPSTNPVEELISMVKYDHPISKAEFEKVIDKHEYLLKNKTKFTNYKDYILDCFVDEGGSVKYDSETVSGWKRRVLFEDFFTKFHVLSVLGEKPKKSYTLAEYNKLFTRFVEYIENDVDEITTSNSSTDNVKYLVNDESVSKITTILTRLENTIYKIGVVGNSARDSLIPLIILRLLQKHFESGEIDIMNLETNGCNKRRINNENIKYVLLKNYTNLPAPDVSTMIQIIWENVLAKNPITEKIFEVGKYVHIKNNSILMAIINELNSFNFESCSADSLSLAYQYFMNKRFREISGSKLGQHFTPDKLINLIINQYGHLIPEDGLYTDPFMGTGGFIMAMYNKMKEKRNPENPSDYIYGTEIDSNVFKYTFTNLLLQTGKVCTNIKNVSAFINHDKKYSAIFTNPPFGDSIPKDEKEETVEYNFAKVLNRNLVCLQYCMHILAPGGVCSMVWAYGSECYGNNKSCINIRKKLFTEFHFEGAILFPEGEKIFEYASVKVIVLTFRKPINEHDIVTPKLKIYRSNEQCNKLELITEANEDQLKKNNYSITVNIYADKSTVAISDNFTLMKLSEIATVERGKYRSGDMNNKGEIPFYNCSAKNPAGTHDDSSFDYEDYIIAICAGGSEKNKYGENVGLGMVYKASGKVACMAGVVAIRVNNEAVKTEYLYYYLKYNRKVIADIAVYTTSLGSVRKETLQDLEIPIPSITEQELTIEECRKIESRLELINKELEIINLNKKNIKWY